MALLFPSSRSLILFAATAALIESCTLIADVDRSKIPDDNGGSPSTGGTHEAGGEAGNGGEPATGGKPGSGGMANATGGVAADGGMGGEGGMVPSSSGGTSGTGGMSDGGAGGSSGAAGDAGAGGATGGDGGAGENTGGKATGGTGTGGTGTGGKATGGTATGGKATGGASSGGSTTGGASSGGTMSGGSTSGGATSGGSTSGGASSGGTTSGGTTSGGSASGGTTSGGSSGNVAGAGGAGGTENGWSFMEDAEGWSARDVSATATFTSDDVEVSWSASGGDPDGAVTAVIGFDAAELYARVGVDVSGAPVDLSGGELTASIQVNSGLTASGDLEAKLYVKSGDAGLFADGAVIALTAEDQWFTLSFDPANPHSAEASFDAADIRELGVQIETATGVTNPVPVTVIIDNVEY